MGHSGQNSGFMLAETWDERHCRRLVDSLEARRASARDDRGRAEVSLEELREEQQRLQQQLEAEREEE
jgi:hypothetical protein